MKRATMPAASRHLIRRPSATGRSGIKTSGALPSRDLQRLFRAADHAAIFLVKGNMPEDFTLEPGREVDPGGLAQKGVDALGNPVWVVDQKVDYPDAPRDLGKCLVDRFYSGAAGTREDPVLTLVAVRRRNEWKEGFQGDPFADPEVTHCLARVSNVWPVPWARGFMPEGSMVLLIDKKSVARRPDQGELTGHFLNPDRKAGPFPGVTDGAVRFRATRNLDGSATLEAYYVTRAAREYLDVLGRFLPPVQMGKALFSLGQALSRMTPLGMLAEGAEGAVKLAARLADRAVGSTDAVRLAVATLHARYYRTVLFPYFLSPSSPG